MSNRDLGDALLVDQAVFSRSIIESLILDSWKKKIWACWKVLNGEAGIVLVRIDPKVYNKRGEK